MAAILHPMNLPRLIKPNPLTILVNTTIDEFLSDKIHDIEISFQGFAK